MYSRMMGQCFVRACDLINKGMKRNKAQSELARAFPTLNRPAVVKCVKHALALAPKPKPRKKLDPLAGIGAEGISSVLTLNEAEGIDSKFFDATEGIQQRESR